MSRCGDEFGEGTQRLPLEAFLRDHAPVLEGEAGKVQAQKQQQQLLLDAPHKTEDVFAEDEERRRKGTNWDEGRAALRQRLTEFYTRHSPSDVERRVLYAMSLGIDEGLLFSSLHRRYGLDAGGNPLSLSTDCCWKGRRTVGGAALLAPHKALVGRRLVAFYAKHDPLNMEAKVLHALSLEVSEEELFSALRRQYSRRDGDGLVLAAGTSAERRERETACGLPLFFTRKKGGACCRVVSKEEEEEVAVAGAQRDALLFSHHTCWLAGSGWTAVCHERLRGALLDDIAAFYECKRDEFYVIASAEPDGLRVTFFLWCLASAQKLETDNFADAIEFQSARRLLLPAASPGRGIVRGESGAGGGALCVRLQCFFERVGTQFFCALDETQRVFLALALEVDIFEHAALFGASHIATGSSYMSVSGYAGVVLHCEVHFSDAQAEEYVRSLLGDDGGGSFVCCPEASRAFALLSGDDDDACEVGAALVLPLLAVAGADSFDLLADAEES